jgi:histidinol-phosphate phosphatase family protein
LLQAVILAGGKGTRLASRLQGKPKPLIDVLSKPLLERQIEQRRGAGVSSVVVLVNHEARQIEAFCADRGGWGVDLRLVDEGEPSGTAGAVFRALDDLAEEFIVVYGDTLFQIDFSRMLAFHRADPGAAASLLLHPNDHPHDSDLVELGPDALIKAFHSYPHPPGVWRRNMVNAALYVVRKSHLASVRPDYADAGIVDFAKDVFPALLAQGGRLRGYVSPEFIKDIGTPERLDRACAALASGKVERASLQHRQSAVFLDRDGVLNRMNGHIATPDDLHLFPFAGDALRELNASEHRVIVVTNQPVLARGECTVEGLDGIHAKLDTLLGRDGAYLEAIYFCPHHPDQGFEGEVTELKIACDCRKPKPGLLLRAQADFNIDLARSWLIGDSEADVRAAHACGATSVLVLTGETRAPSDLSAPADFVCADIASAAHFIVQTYPALSASAAPLVEALVDGGRVTISGGDEARRSIFIGVLARDLRVRGVQAAVVSTWDETATAAVTLFQEPDPMDPSSPPPTASGLQIRMLPRDASEADGWVEVVLAAGLGEEAA